MLIQWVTLFLVLLLLNRQYYSNRLELCVVRIRIIEEALKQ